MGDSCWCAVAGVAVVWQRLQLLQGVHSQADGTSRKVNVHLVPLRGNKLAFPKKEKMNSFKFCTQPIVLEVKCKIRRVSLLCFLLFALAGKQKVS